MTNATIVRATIAMVRVPIRAIIEFVLNWLVVDEKIDCMRSRRAELWPPKSEDMVEEVAGVELV